MIENKDTIIIPNKDLSVEITGHIQEKKGKQPITIKITKPDGRVEKIHTSTNEKGYYFIPTVLDERWQKGTYKVTALFKSGIIGEIEFSIDDKHGIGGKILSFSERLERKIQAVDEQATTLEEFRLWLTEQGIESSVIDHIQDRMLLFNISNSS